jgi:hypothetical protein
VTCDVVVVNYNTDFCLLPSPEREAWEDCFRQSLAEFLRAQGALTTRVESSLAPRPRRVGSALLLIIRAGARMVARDGGRRGR